MNTEWLLWDHCLYDTYQQEKNSGRKYVERKDVHTFYDYTFCGFLLFLFLFFSGTIPYRSLAAETGLLHTSLQHAHIKEESGTILGESSSPCTHEEWCSHGIDKFFWLQKKKWWWKGKKCPEVEGGWTNFRKTRGEFHVSPDPQLLH